MSRTVARSLAVVVLALGCFACGGYKTPIESAAAEGAAVVQQAVDTIVDGSFAVAPRAFKNFEINVGQGMANPRVEGTFTASGARNDIEVLLLDEHQFSNWQNRHAFKSTYASGRVTADRLRIELPDEPGKYFVIFSNRFSMFANKDVVADVKLHYDRN